MLRLCAQIQGFPRKPATPAAMTNALNATWPPQPRCQPRAQPGSPRPANTKVPATMSFLAVYVDTQVDTSPVFVGTRQPNSACASTGGEQNPPPRQRRRFIQSTTPRTSTPTRQPSVPSPTATTASSDHEEAEHALPPPSLASSPLWPGSPRSQQRIGDAEQARPRPTALACATRSRDAPPPPRTGSRSRRPWHAPTASSPRPTVPFPTSPSVASRRQR